MSDSIPVTSQITQQPVSPSIQKDARKRRSSLRYIFRLFRHHLVGQQRLFGLALVMLIAEAVTAIFAAYPLAYLIDYLKGDRPDILTLLGASTGISPLIATVAVLTTAIVLLAMTNSLCDSLAEIYLAKGGRVLGYNLRLALYSHLQRLSLAFHDQRRTGDVLTRVTGDVTALEDFIIRSFSDIVGSLLLLAGTIVFLVYNSWQVALVGAVIIPLMAFVSNYFSQRIKAAAKKQRAREGDLASSTQEMLTSIRVIQTYNRGSHELKRFAEHNQKNVDAALEAAGLQARFSWIVNVLESLAIAAVVWLGLWLIQRATITVGMLLMFIVLIQNMFKPARKIIKEWNTIGKIYASVERIGELLDREPAVSDAPDAVEAPLFQGHINFEHVSFAYHPDPDEQKAEKHQDAAPIRQALRDVSFNVAPNEILALVGHTGAGKSTIVQLLPRLYDSVAGRILIDGQDIRKYTLASLREQISVVLQETILFNGTVTDNIAYGRTNATRDQILEAAIQANAHEFIKDLPQGYDTMLGERGANLSGGQRQRIAIARAFIRNAPILILDEPTTGLDAESADLVLLALRVLMKGKTTLIISHDLKLIRHANKIVVLKEGVVKETGTHAELLQAKGVYANFYLRQFGQTSGDEEEEPLPLALLQSQSLRQKLPTLPIVFDAEAMRAHLQEALFDAKENHYTIESCTPGKATYLDGEGCLLRYDLVVKEQASGQVLTPLVLARVSADSAAAATYLHERLEPLAAQMDGRPEIAPFAAPIALLESLNMVVSLFPIDGELPALVAATHRPYMLERLRHTLSKAGLDRFNVEDCHVTLGHYGRQHRCVLRYQVDGRWQDSGQTTQQILYGKVAADGRGELVDQALTALHKHLASGDNLDHFNLPRGFGYQPDLQLVLLEAIPGRPQITDLLKAQLDEEGTGPQTIRTMPPLSESGLLTIGKAIATSARMAAMLHTSAITLGQPRTLRDELAALQEQLFPVWQLSPALAIQLQEVLKQVRHYGEHTTPSPLCFSHGDYTHTQLLFDGTAAGLVDFDTVCQAEPALDLGQFQAYLRQAVLKAQSKSAGKMSHESPIEGEAHEPNPAPSYADLLCTQFFNMYLSTSDYSSEQAEQLRVRVQVYEIVSLLRMALHSWQKLKESRLAHVITLLEERIACLPPLSHQTFQRKSPLYWLGGARSRRRSGLRQH
jgi:ABC-type multidrug transport system fused ATPase/permease subunit/thiamine kinase-like enzyme